MPAPSAARHEQEAASDHRHGGSPVHLLTCTQAPDDPRTTPMSTKALNAHLNSRGSRARGVRARGVMLLPSYAGEARWGSSAGRRSCATQFAHWSRGGRAGSTPRLRSADMVRLTLKRVTQTLRSFGIVVMFTNSAKISTPIGIMKSMEHPLREQVFRDLASSQRAGWRLRWQTGGPSGEAHGQRLAGEVLAGLLQLQGVVSQSRTSEGGHRGPQRGDT